MTAFISYSKSRDDRAALVYALREHGVTPWRDVEDLNVGARTTDDIEAELERCTSAILWVNADILNSDYVEKVELPALSRAARKRDLRIIPIFDGMSPEEATDRISTFGIEVGENNGHVVGKGDDAESAAITIAGRCAQAEVRAARDSGRKPSVRLVTYDDTAPMRDQAVLNLDWRHRFTGPTLQAPDQDRLRSALSISTGALKSAYGATEILLAVKAHLPAAAALGHAFAEPTGCTLRMDRSDERYVISRDVASSTELVENRHSRGPITAGRAAIEVAVTRATEAGVNDYIASGNRYRERIELVPPGGSGRSALDEPASCNAWARQIADLATQLCDRGEIDAVDLFLACPVELAVAIGWWANATGILTVLNWTAKAGPYTPMWHLS